MTQWAELVADLVHRIQRDFEATLSDIDPGWLDRSPGPGANPIGWLAWHLTRSHDRNVSELSEREQLWIAGGWAARFGRAPDPAETGFAHTAERVSTSATLGATRPVRARLVGVLVEGLEHVGQMAYLRGLWAGALDS